MKKTRDEIIEFINTLSGYEGYVQFSDEKIRPSDIFEVAQDIKLEQTKGFIHEAHFCNEIESLSIKQINDAWFVSKTQLSEIKDKKSDIQVYYALGQLKVKMAQIWEEENDVLCENLPVLKLKKVVFAGFEKGEIK